MDLNSWQESKSSISFYKGLKLDGWRVEEETVRRKDLLYHSAMPLCSPFQKAHTHLLPESGDIPDFPSWQVFSCTYGGLSSSSCFHLHPPILIAQCFLNKTTYTNSGGVSAEAWNGLIPALEETSSGHELTPLLAPEPLRTGSAPASAPFVSEF